MKVATLETLYCDAGWRPWIFLKATTDDGLVGWSEVTDSHGSPRGLAGIVEDLAPLVVGRDPRAGEAVYWDLYRATRQSPGGVVAKAIAAIENALLDLTAKALGVPVYELFGGPLRTTCPLYWSHCGTTRARAWEVTGTPKLASYDDVTALGREVVERGYPAFKTNIVVPGDDPQVLHARLPRPGSSGTRRRRVEEALVRLLEAFAAGTGGKAEPIVDLNFNLETEGARRTRGARAVRPAWLEIDCFDPDALAFVRHVDVDPDLLRRESLRHARLPAVLRSRRDRRRVSRRDLERLRTSRRRSPTSRRHSRSTARRTTTTATSRPSSRRSGARPSPTCGSSRSTSTTCPWKDELTAAPDITGRSAARSQPARAGAPR